MTRYLNPHGIRLCDYPQFAIKLRDRVRDCPATLAAEAGSDNRAHSQEPHSHGGGGRAGSRSARGHHPGPVHIISAIEACDDTDQPWRDKQTHNVQRPQRLDDLSRQPSTRLRFDGIERRKCQELADR
jgi:hypothetical protein